MSSKNFTLRFGAVYQGDERANIGGELRIHSSKQMLQGASYLKTALGLETQEAQHLFTDEQARNAIVKHKRVSFG